MGFLKKKRRIIDTQGMLLGCFFFRIPSFFTQLAFFSTVFLITFLITFWEGIFWGIHKGNSCRQLYFRNDECVHLQNINIFIWVHSTASQWLIARKHEPQKFITKYVFSLELMEQLLPNLDRSLFWTIEFTTEIKLTFKGHKGQKRPGFWAS